MDDPRLGDPRRPEWTPDDAGEAFAGRYVAGTSTPQQPTESRGRAPRLLSVDEYAEGVLAGDRATLARAITLIESNAPTHIDLAQQVLGRLLPRTGGALRVGITGVPGAGKSTLIETLGMNLIADGRRVGVLAVDPTSSLSGGSILGDKTRMERLSREPSAFIRPSPTGGMLGGVARKTRETILLLEAAGFDVILVETVGTGQSEIAVRSMVDFFLLLLIPGAGDELQGIKKGVVELADAIFINKADGENRIRAEAARAEYNRALHYLTPPTEGWTPRAYSGSALTGDGLAPLWGMIERFRSTTTASGAFEARRREQARDWLRALVEEQVLARFYEREDVRAALLRIEEAVMRGETPPTAAARELLGSGGEREQRSRGAD